MKIYELRNTRGQNPDGPRSYAAAFPDGTYAVHLQLTQEGAIALLAVTDKIGGIPEETPRGMFDALGIALREAGVHTRSSCGLLGGSGVEFSSWPPKKTPKEEAIEVMKRVLSLNSSETLGTQELRAAVERLSKEDA